MNLFSKVVTGGTHIEEAALYLLRAMVRDAVNDPAFLPEHPAVAEAIRAAEAAAMARGLPVEMIESAVLRMVREFVNPPVSPVA